MTREAPWHAEISGVAVVTIPLDHYAELLACRKLCAENGYRALPTYSAASRVERDPEVAAFLAEGARGMTIDHLYTACQDPFGTERTPSRSSIKRYRQRLRAK